jgi:hypothetical protein
MSSRVKGPLLAPAPSPLLSPPRSPHPPPPLSPACCRHCATAAASTGTWSLPAASSSATASPPVPPPPRERAVPPSAVATASSGGPTFSRPTARARRARKASGRISASGRQAAAQSAQSGRGTPASTAISKSPGMVDSASTASSCGRASKRRRSCPGGTAGKVSSHICRRGPTSSTLFRKSRARGGRPCGRLSRWANGPKPAGQVRGGPRSHWMSPGDAHDGVPCWQGRLGPGASSGAPLLASMVCTHLLASSPGNACSALSTAASPSAALSVVILRTSVAASGETPEMWAAASATRAAVAADRPHSAMSRSVRPPRAVAATEAGSPSLLAPALGPSRRCRPASASRPRGRPRPGRGVGGAAAARRPEARGARRPAQLSPARGRPLSGLSMPYVVVRD